MAWLGWAAAVFFLAWGIYMLFWAKHERDEALKANNLFGPGYLNHPSYVPSMRLGGAIAILVALGLFWLMITQR